MCAKKKVIRQNTLFSADFYSDMEEDGMLYGAIIRSPFAGETVSDVFIENLPPEYKIITHRDIPGKKLVKTLGSATPVFCTGKIAYEGEPLGLLVGPDAKVVSELLQKVQIFTELKSVQEEKETASEIDLSKPIQEKKTESESELQNQLRSTEEVTASSTLSDAETAVQQMTQPDLASQTQKKKVLCERNLLYLDGQSVPEDDEHTEQFFEVLKTSDAVIESEWDSTLSQINYGETNGSLCSFKDGILHVYTASLWLRELRKVLSDVTGLDADHIVITKTASTNLHTNMLWRNSIIASQASVAAMICKKPVMLILSREEQNQFMENPVPVKVHYTAGVSKTGIIRALDVTIDIDAGVWNPFAKEIVDRLTIASCGIYKFETLRIHTTASNSHHPPTSVNLRTIDAQAFFAIENAMQHLCEKTGFTPLEFRLANAPQANTKKQQLPFTIGCSKIKETLEAVCRTSDFLRKYTTYRLSEADRYETNYNSPSAPPLRGAGLACAFEGGGYLGTTLTSAHPTLEVTQEKDGTIKIHAIPPSPSIWNIWKKTVCQILEIEESKVMLDSAFKIDSEPESPEDFSSNIGVITELLEKCCLAIKQKKNPAYPLTVKKTIAPSVKKLWNSEKFEGTPFISSSFGAAVIEIELDPCTYRENLRGIWVVINCGRILSVRAAENTVKSAIQQSLSTLVEQESLRCENIRVQFVQSDEEPKQLGAIVHSLIPAAFSSALSQALASPLTHLPMQTDTLYKITKIAAMLHFEQKEKEKQEEEAEAKGNEEESQEKEK